MNSSLAFTSYCDCLRTHWVFRYFNLLQDDTTRGMSGFRAKMQYTIIVKELITLERPTSNYLLSTADGNEQYSLPKWEAAPASGATAFARHFLDIMTILVLHRCCAVAKERKMGAIQIGVSRVSALVLRAFQRWGLVCPALNLWLSDVSSYSWHWYYCMMFRVYLLLVPYFILEYYVVLS
jgi:hypothetical protein